MHIVLLNGPAGAGKNTLANQMKVELQTRINNQHSTRKLLKRSVSSIAIEEHKQLLIDMLFSFAESLSEIEYGLSRSEALYADLKKRFIMGRTGRQWQIIWADAMRAADSAIFIDSLHKKLRAIDPDIALVPDCGFPDEASRAVGRFGSSNVTLIYLDGWEKDAPIYSHLDRFNDDIRVCLRNSAHLVNPGAGTAVSYILGRMHENAAQKTLDF